MGTIIQCDQRPKDAGIHLVRGANSKRARESATVHWDKEIGPKTRQLDLSTNRLQ